MKVVALTSPTVPNVWLVNQLLERHDVVGIVIEEPASASTREDKLERRRKMVRRYGVVRTANKLLFNAVRSRFLSDRAAGTLREIFFPRGAAVAYSREVPTVTVSNINDPACVEHIQRLRPDVLAVCGTTVIKPSVFTLAPRGAINMHTGITPEYRSADPIFWALYNGEVDKVGVTIHMVDKGIDTGGIIYQRSVPVYADDSLVTISARCIRHGADLFSRALTDAENGCLRTIPKAGAPSRAFLSVDLGLAQWLLFHWRFWHLASNLPRRPAGIEADAAAGA